MITKSQYQSDATAAAAAQTQAKIDAKVVGMVEGALNAVKAQGDGTGVTVSFPPSWNVTPGLATVAAAGYTVTAGNLDANNRDYTIS